jgi:hypothetical protein
MTRQEEVAAGLQTLTEIFKKSGLNIRETKRPWPDRDATYLVFGGLLLQPQTRSAWREATKVRTFRDDHD